MPFDRLPSNDIQVPLPQLVTPPARPVIPYAEYAKTLMEAISRIAEDFSPEAKAKKEALLAQARYLTRFYDEGGKRDPLLRYKQQDYMSRVNRNNAMAFNYRNKARTGIDQTPWGSLFQLTHPAAPDEEGHGRSGTHPALNRPAPVEWNADDPARMLQTLDMSEQPANPVPSDAAPLTGPDLSATSEGDTASYNMEIPPDSQEA